MRRKRAKQGMVGEEDKDAENLREARARLPNTISGIACRLGIVVIWLCVLWVLSNYLFSLYP